MRIYCTLHSLNTHTPVSQTSVKELPFKYSESTEAYDMYQRMLRNVECSVNVKRMHPTVNFCASDMWQYIYTYVYSKV